MKTKAHIKIEIEFNEEEKRKIDILKKEFNFGSEHISMLTELAHCERDPKASFNKFIQSIITVAWATTVFNPYFDENGEVSQAKIYCQSCGKTFSRWDKCCEHRDKHQIDLCGQRIDTKTMFRHFIV